VCHCTQQIALAQLPQTNWQLISNNPDKGLPGWRMKADGKCGPSTSRRPLPDAHQLPAGTTLIANDSVYVTST
jgi:hypothetical protein